MSEISSPQNWWQLPIKEFPQAFSNDQRTMEEQRLSSLLSTDNAQVAGTLWERLRRAATLLEISALEKDSLEKPSRIWELVALIHEAIGVAEPERKDYQWLLSALSWQLAGLPAISELLASKLIEQPNYSKRDIVEQIAISFSRRGFPELRRLADLAIRDGNVLQGEFSLNGDLSNAIEAGSLLSIGTAMRGLGSYTRDGEPFSDKAALEDFLKITLSTGDSRRYRIGRLLLECVDRFIAASSQLVIGQVQSLTGVTKQNILAHLADYPELWTSQQEAIEKGLLDKSKKHFVVAIPTSSGKTLCGELVMIQELTDSPESTCFYVVPTRALVEEKSKELQRKLEGKFQFRVGAATGALQQDEIESEILKNVQVIVCTPEKLDLLIRHSDKSLQQANLFVIDESHLIDDKERGLGIEFVVIKLLMLKPDSKLLLLSAMLPNSEDFGKWLAQDSAVCSSSWRPTRQKFGEIEFRKLSPKGASLDIKIYGTEAENSDLLLPVRQYSSRPNTIIEQISRAVEVLRHKGTVLIFCMKKERCEKIVEELVNERRAANIINAADAPQSKAIDALRDKIKREVANEFLLGEALLYRIAYHHADILSRIRIELESLIANNFIDVIVSTTTLAEGVNLPISTVIFEDWMTKFDRRIPNAKPRVLDLSKFRNIAGRAGRAGKETEGMALFLSPSRKLIPQQTGGG